MPSPHPPAPRPQVDSLAWVADAAILVSCKLLTGGAEEVFAPLAMLSWRGASPAPGAVALAEFFANNISEDATPQGPWLQAATVPQVRRSAPANPTCKLRPCSCIAHSDSAQTCAVSTARPAAVGCHGVCAPQGQRRPRQGGGFD